MEAFDEVKGGWVFEGRVDIKGVPGSSVDAS
jgi:hypothetical protein